jgi:hypothetical protein
LGARRPFLAGAWRGGGDERVDQSPGDVAYLFDGAIDSSFGSF